MPAASAAAVRNAATGTRLGHIGGVPIRLSRSWPISMVIVVGVVALLAGRVLPDRSWASVLISAATLTLMLMLSVLLHELGHLFAARLVGQRVLQIRFDVLGGRTDLVGSAATAGRDALVALAGPLISAACSGLGVAVAAALTRHSVPWLLAMTVGVVNALLTVFNLLPALPLDGGQLVSSLGQRISGSRRTGALIGYLSSVVVCALMVAAAVVLWIRDPASGRVQAVVIAAMALHLAAAGWAEWRSERRPSVGRRAGDASWTIITAERLAWMAQPLPSGGKGSPPDPSALVLSTDDAEQIGAALRRTSSDRFRLIDDDGNPAGILSRADLTRMLGGRPPPGADPNAGRPDQMSDDGGPRER